jgi:hypothetical protein
MQETPLTFSEAMARRAIDRVSAEIITLIAEHGPSGRGDRRRLRLHVRLLRHLYPRQNYLIHDEDGVEGPSTCSCVALGIHGDDILAALDVLAHVPSSDGAQLPPVQRGDGAPQMSSCYLVDMFEDSIDGI